MCTVPRDAVYIICHKQHINKKETDFAKNTRNVRTTLGVTDWYSENSIFLFLFVYKADCLFCRKNISSCITIGNSTSCQTKDFQNKISQVCDTQNVHAADLDQKIQLNISHAALTIAF